MIGKRSGARLSKLPSAFLPLRLSPTSWTLAEAPLFPSGFREEALGSLEDDFKHVGRTGWWRVACGGRKAPSPPYL